MSAEGYINRWWRVAGALLMNLSLGSLYAWSIFVAPLEKEFGWNRADTSWIFTTFGGIMGFGNGFGYATPIPVLSKWFPDRRGLAVGLAVAGYGGGSAILAFIGPPMLTGLGWRGTFLWLGIGFFVATIIGAFMLKNPPAGWKPAGWVPPPPTAKVAATTYDYPPSEMVKTPQFPLMWIGYCLGTSAGLMTISQLIPFARSVGLPATAATLTLLIGAIGKIGRAS